MMLAKKELIIEWIKKMIPCPLDIQNRILNALEVIETHVDLKDLDSQINGIDTNIEKAFQNTLPALQKTVNNINTDGAEFTFERELIKEVLITLTGLSTPSYRLHELEVKNVADWFEGYTEDARVEIKAAILGIH